MKYDYAMASYQLTKVAIENNKGSHQEPFWIETATESLSRRSGFKLLDLRFIGVNAIWCN
jgi:hypothetical protein